MQTAASKLAITIAAGMLLSATVPAFATTDLTVWRLKSFVAPADAILDTNLQECAQQIGANVNIQTYSFDDMWTRYTAAIESRTLPDLAEMDSIGPARLAALKRLEDVSDIVADAGSKLGGVLPNVENALKFDGKFYAVPHYSIPIMLHYRVDLLESADKAVPTNWEELNAASLAIKESGAMAFPSGFPWNRTGDGYDPAMSLLWNYGAAWVDTEGKLTGLPVEQTKKAIEIAAAPYIKDKTSAPDYVSWSGAANNESFLAGNIAFTPNGPSVAYLAESMDLPIKDKIGMTTMPAGPEGHNLALPHLMNWAVPIDGGKQAKAKELLNCVISEERITKYMTGAFHQIVPLFTKLLEDEYWSADKDKVLADAVRRGNPVGWPGPTTEAAAEVISSHVLTDMMTRVIVDGVTPETAIEEANAKLEEIYNRSAAK